MLYCLIVSDTPGVCPDMLWGDSGPCCPADCVGESTVQLDCRDGEAGARIFSLLLVPQRSRGGGPENSQGPRTCFVHADPVFPATFSLGESR